MSRNDNYLELTDKLAKQPNYEMALKVVYQWVKDGYISSKMMGDLNVYQKIAVKPLASAMGRRQLYKKFIY